MIVRRKTKASPEQIEQNLRKALDKLTPKQYIVIALVQSNSDESKWYEIRLGLNNAAYCTCKGWQYRQACDHMKRFRSRQQQQKIGR